MSAPDIAETIAERQNTHGEFDRTSGVYEALWTAMRENRRRGFTPELSHALSMICVKLARITCGDAGHADHFYDIEGYARLARESLAGEVLKPGAKS